MLYSPSFRLSCPTEVANELYIPSKSCILSIGLSTLDSQSVINMAGEGSGDATVSGGEGPTMSNVLEDLRRQVYQLLG